MHFRRFVIPFVFIALVAFFSCGDPDEGSLAFRLVWPEGARLLEMDTAEEPPAQPIRPLVPTAEYDYVVTVNAALYEGTQLVIEQSRPYYLHRGELSATPGTYLLVITGLGLNDQVMYRGEKPDVRVKGGSTTQVGEILMESVW